MTAYAPTVTVARWGPNPVAMRPGQGHTAVMLVMRLLGPPEIEVDGRALRVDTRKAVALLAYLAMTGGTDRDHLVDLLWPGYDVERGRASLRRTLSALRSGLGEGWIQADRLRVSLTGAVELDVERLKRLEDLHRHPPGESCESCLDLLRSLAGLSRGDFMQGFTVRGAPGFEEWQIAESHRVRSELGRVLTLRLDACRALGNDDETVAVARDLIALDPLNEAAYRALMTVHGRRGDRGALVTTYRELVAILEAELGVEPLEETSELYRALSRGGGTTGTEAALESHPETIPELPFTGRTAEWMQLSAAYRAASAGLIVAIEGEPGIGKTRLAEEFIQDVREQGARTVLVRSHEGEANVAYGVLTQALRELVTSSVIGRLDEADLAELARLLPEIDSAPADSVFAARFYEAVRAAFEEGLRGDQLGVVVFDDIHWCDPATLDALAYVARRIHQTRAALVFTWRSGEVENDPLAGTTPEANVTRVRLGRWGKEELRSVLSNTIPSPEDRLEEIVDRLYGETEGVPLFVAGYLEARATGNWEVPQTVRGLVIRRLDAARGVAREILDSAAVIDRAFDFETMRRVAGRDDLDTANALDNLTRRGLLRGSAERDGTTYEFSHDKLRVVAYEEMGPARRRVLHRRVAEALVASTPVAEREGPLAAAIARHFKLGGEGERAAAYHRLAGFWARDVFAHAQALAHFEQALALGEGSAELYEAIGDARVLRGEYAQALASYERAAAMADQSQDIDRKLGDVYIRRGDYELAQLHLLDALRRASGDERIADVLVDLSLVARRLGDEVSARDRATEAIERARRTKKPVIIARAENAMGMISAAGGDWEAARSHLRAALERAREVDDLQVEIAALNNLALLERRLGDLDAAVELTSKALEACRRLGDRHREAALENNLSDLFHEKGDSEKAMAGLKRATAIFAEVGEDPKGPLPEVWKLVEW